MPTLQIRFLALVLCALVVGHARAACDGAFLHNGVTAHRGDSAAHPENTLRAFQRALDLGVDWIELDIFRTADGKLVVLHDATTERVADEKYTVAETTFEVLQLVDVAAKFRKSRGLSLEECPPARIPLLEEVLALIKTQRCTRISIQPKMDIVDEAVALVQAMGLEAWVGFNDGDLKKMRRVKALAPAIPVFWDRGANWNATADIATALECGFEGLVVHVAGITRKNIEAVHAAGLEAGAWTVNDIETMRRLLELGVDRIYTDEPARLLKLRASAVLF